MSETDEPLGENTVLTDVLGDHALPKLLTVFLTHDDKDMNVTELARLAGVDRSTVYRNLDRLQEYNIITQTRTVGNSKMFALNRDSSAARALAEFEYELIGAAPDQETAVSD